MERTGTIGRFFFTMITLSVILNCRSVYGNGDSLAPYLEKHGVSQKELLFIIAINPAECAKYKLELTQLSDKIDKENISQDVLYIIKGLRQKEIAYFRQKELNFISPKSKMISDDDFYYRVNSFPGSSITIVSYNEVRGSFPINQALSRIHISGSPGYHLTFVDSVILNEDKNIISNLSRIKVIDDTRLLLLDNTYNYLVSYDMVTGKVLARLTPEYDYAGLFKTYINPDPVQVEFAQRGTKVIDQYHMKPFSMDNIYVNGKNTYVTCKFMYAEYGGGKDTFLTYYPFMIKTDIDLEKHEFIGIPDQPGSFSTLVQNAFWTDNDTNFVFTVSRGKNDSTYKYLASFNYLPAQRKFVFDKMLSPRLPDFFVKNRINYSFGPTGSFRYGNSMYSYFNWLIPYAYNTSGNGTIAFADSSISKADIYTWKQARLPFEIITASAVSDDDIAYVSSSPAGFDLKVIKASDGKVIYSYRLPEKFESGKTELLGDHLYILKPGDDHACLYKFKLR